MLESLIARIRSRSRDEYLQLAREKLISIRIWIQEHPEPAFLVAIALGALLILMFKFILSLGGLAVVFAFVIYSIAQPASAQQRGGSVTPTTGGPADSVN